MTFRLAYTNLARVFSPFSTSTDVVRLPHDHTSAMLVRQLSEQSGESQNARIAREKKEEEEREKLIQKNYKVPMARLFSYNRPEWPYFIPAILGALIDGSAMPLCTVALVGSMEGFFKEKEQMREDLEWMCIIFVLIAVSCFIGSTISHGCFSILGEAMTQRLRVAILTSMFRQEVGFHDNPENTPGMLSKALELWAFRVATLCKSIQAKVRRVCKSAFADGTTNKNPNSCMFFFKRIRFMFIS